MPRIVYTIEYENDMSSLDQEAKKAKSTMDKAFQGSSSNANRSTQATKEQEEALKEYRKELRRKIALVDADLRLGNKSQQEAEESIQQIKQWAEAQGAFNRETLTGAMNIKTFANAQNRAKNDFRGMSAVTNRANQVLFDLNQGLQDIPFGMRGIGNNIPFVIEGFRRFGRAAREDGISPLKGFIGALASPAGLIGTAAAVIPTIITLMSNWDQFLSQWGISVEESTEKSKTFREELVELRSDIDRFQPRIDVLRDLQESLFPDQGELQGMRQQLQLSREVEGTLLNELDAQEQKVEKLEHQVDIFERIENKQLSAAKAAREGLVTQEVAEGIGQGRVDVEETLRKKKEQLNEATIRQKSLETSVENAQEDQVNTLAEIESIQAALNSSTMDGLVNQALNRDMALNRQATHQELLRIMKQQTGELENQVALEAEKQREEDQADRMASTLERITAVQDVELQTRVAQAEGFEKKRLQLVKNRIDTEQDLIDAGVSRERAASLSKQLFHAEMEQAKTEETKRQAQQRQQIISQANQAIFGGAENLFSSLQQLNQARDAQNERQAREKFERQKSLSKASAVVQGLSAIVSAFNPYVPILSEARAAMIGTTTAIQVRAIEQQEFDSSSMSGKFSGGGGAGSSAPEQGFSTTDLSRQPQSSNPTNFAQGGEQKEININVTNKIDRKGAALLVREGEKEIKSDLIGV